MSKTKIWILFDGRYRTDEDRAVCYEVCETLKDTKEKLLESIQDFLKTEKGGWCIV